MESARGFEYLLDKGIGNAVMANIGKAESVIGVEKVCCQRCASWGISISAKEDKSKTGRSMGRLAKLLDTRCRQ